MPSCHICSCEMVMDSIPHRVERPGYTLELSALPAWTCINCGASLVEEEVVARLQETLQALDDVVKESRKPKG